MAKKPLGKDQFGIQKVMRGGDYFADSMGQFALNAISGMVGQLTYFYTDKAGLAAGMVATVFMVTKIVDAFTDIIMGNIIDHTKPGKERYRPWILKMAIPAALMLLLLFTVPKGSAGLQVAYMLVTNLLMTSVIYTAIAIPYASLQVVRTNSSEERGKMGVYRALAGYVPGMAIVLAVIPVTNALGGTQSAWIKFAAVVALVVALCLLFCYKKSRETATAYGLSWQEALSVLRIWEYTGQARRGYFVEGLSGAQFIQGKDYASVVRMLQNPEKKLIWINAADPVQCWGKVLPHKEGRNFLNVPGTAVACLGGIPIAVMERQGTVLRVFEQEPLEECLILFSEEYKHKKLFVSKKRIVVKNYPDAAKEALERAGFYREMQDYVLYR